MNNKWIWFCNMVRAEIEPILATYGFRRLPDDVDEDNEKAFALFYENATNDEIITIDILRYIELGSSPVIGYFLTDVTHRAPQNEVDYAHER